MKKRSYQIGQSTLTLQFGDLTTSDAEVLVSSDDWYVTMGGGVSAAILRAGGQSILIDAAKKVPAKLGDVVVTSGGSLRAKYVFHAITIGSGTVHAKEVITSATRRCLELVDALGLKSIAFPAIGAGAAGFAYEEVAATMAQVLVDYVRQSQRPIDASIYLYDRFGRMQPLDYVTFFEQFAIRMTGLQPVTTPRARKDRKTPRTVDKKPSKPEKRRRLLLQLAELDQERQTLETRLAEYAGALSRTDISEVMQRLKDVHEKHVEVLSEVKPDTWRLPVTEGALRAAIVEAFSTEELELLCANLQESLVSKGVKLQVTLEVVGGKGKPTQVLNLIEYLKRRGHLSALIDAVEAERPGLLKTRADLAPPTSEGRA